jgi:hypothetical protein
VTKLERQRQFRRFAKLHSAAVEFEISNPSVLCSFSATGALFWSQLKDIGRNMCSALRLLRSGRHKNFMSEVQSIYRVPPRRIDYLCRCNLGCTEHKTFLPCFFNNKIFLLWRLLINFLLF